jgi:hypothetical protein
MLDQWVPFDAAKGEEGVSVQGSLLIALLILIGATAWRGFENIRRRQPLDLGQPGADRGHAAGGGAALCRLDGGLRIVVTGKLARASAPHCWPCWHPLCKASLDRRTTAGLAVGIVALREADLPAAGGRRVRRRHDPRADPPEWIEAWPAATTLLANLAGVVFGVFMYFPTLVEVPIAKMFLDLGMHRGPLLAYLMADPELSCRAS